MVTRTVVLTGGRAGQTCKLNHGRFHFIDGRIVLRGDGANVARQMRILATQYQAYELGSDELRRANGERDISTDPGEDVQPSLLGGVQPDGTGPSPEADANGSGPASPASDSTGDGSVPARDGHADPRLDRIKAALNGLDPENDKHWTADGFPKVAVIKNLIPDVSRYEIEKAAPGFNRGV